MLNIDNEVRNAIKDLREFAIYIPTYSKFDVSSAKKNSKGKIFPIIFKVFIENGKVVAISNANSKLDNLPDTIQTRRQAQDCLDYANTVNAMMKVNGFKNETYQIYFQSNKAGIFKYLKSNNDNTRACFSLQTEISGYILGLGQTPLPLRELYHIPAENL